MRGEMQDEAEMCPGRYWKRNHGVSHCLIALAV